MLPTVLAGQDVSSRICLEPVAQARPPTLSGTGRAMAHHAGEGDAEDLRV